MCGISGYMDLKRGVNSATLLAMNRVIRHRGPDDEGYVLIGNSGILGCGGNDTLKELRLPDIRTENGREYFLGFGHRRLSILDLTAAGHQPMMTEDGQLVIVFNGEIYNYKEVRRELEESGCRFRTGCDTEVVLQAYKKWGSGCLERFNGMWSFVIWDQPGNLLFCSRDRLGAKPFHYFLGGGGTQFLFGSELKQICQVKGLRKRLDKAFLAADMSFRISDYNERTMISCIRALPPGHNMILRLSEERTVIRDVKTERYWDLSCGYEEETGLEEWVERIRAEFSRSVAWRLRSDVPVGALLSGGLDSSYMTAEICSHLDDPSKLQTFTTSYPGHDKVEEWQFADLVNTHCGCQGYRYTPHPEKQGIEKEMEDLLWHMEMPVSISLAGVRSVIRKAREAGCKVILNGQCGDESWLGYERYYAFYFQYLARNGKLKEAVKESGLAGRHSGLTLRELLLYYMYFNFPAVRNARALRRAGRFCTKKLMRHLRMDEFCPVIYPKEMEDLQYRELTGTQLTHIVHFDDRCYMAESVESRIPFMDYRLVELAVKVPAELKIHNGYTKYIIRKACEDRLPAEVVWRTNKMGFESPVDLWYRSFSRDYMMSMFEGAVTKELFDTGKLREMYINNPASEDVFYFIQTELFARKFHCEV